MQHVVALRGRGSMPQQYNSFSYFFFAGLRPAPRRGPGALPRANRRPCGGVAPRYGKCWNICCLLMGSANVGTICGTNSYTLTYDRPGTHGWTDLPRTVSRPFRPTPWAVLAAPRVMPGPVMPGVQRTPGRLRGGDAPGGPDLPPCPGYRTPYITQPLTFRPQSQQA